MSIVTRVGLPIPGGELLAHCKARKLPCLVSANALYARDKDGRGRFRLPPPGKFEGVDCALDSGGFVAMSRYNGFPYTLEEYVELAQAAPWAWVAPFDLCVESSIAQNRAEVQLRLAGTVRNYYRLAAYARDLPLPYILPTLQGATARDYLWCVDQMGLAHDDGAKLIGVGSMCRRETHGPDGILAIVETLDRALPPGTSLHLFGVKSDSLAPLAGHPRVGSIDSCAWDLALRMDLRRGRDMEIRKAAIDHWYAAQQVRLLGQGQRVACSDVEAIRQMPYQDLTFGYADLILEGAMEYEDARGMMLYDPDVQTAVAMGASCPFGPEQDKEPDLAQEDMERWLRELLATSDAKTNVPTIRQEVPLY